MLRGALAQALGHAERAFQALHQFVARQCAADRGTASVGADQQALVGAQRAPGIGAQLESFAARAGVAAVARVAEEAQVQLRPGVFGFELGPNLALGIVEQQLVVAAAVQLLAANAGQRVVAWQRAGLAERGRLLELVIDAPGNERQVGVAVQVLDDDLLADARQQRLAPGGAGQAARHADPARTVFVGRRVAIPAEMDLHLAVLVGPDLAPGGAGDDRGLRPDHLWPGGAARRTILFRRVPDVDVGMPACAGAV